MAPLLFRVPSGVAVTLAVVVASSATGPSRNGPGGWSPILPVVGAFQVPPPASSSSSLFPRWTAVAAAASARAARPADGTGTALASTGDDSGDSSSSTGPGMEDAFRRLEELTFPDMSGGDIGESQKGRGFGGSSSSSSPGARTGGKKKTAAERDEAFARAMKELDLKDFVAPTAGLEAEAELYKDMAAEVAAAGGSDDGLRAALTVDLMDADEVLERARTRATERFMDRAIDEALRDAVRGRGEDDDAEPMMDRDTLLDNKEIMGEIEKIFDKANEELLRGIEEIRAEQVRVFFASAVAHPYVTSQARSPHWSPTV